MKRRQTRDVPHDLAQHALLSCWRYLALAGQPRSRDRAGHIERARSCYDEARAALTAARAALAAQRDRVVAAERARQTDRGPKPHEKGALTHLQPIVHRLTDEAEQLGMCLAAYTGSPVGRGGQEWDAIRRVECRLFGVEPPFYRCAWCGSMEMAARPHVALDVAGYAVARRQAGRFCCAACLQAGKDRLAPPPPPPLAAAPVQSPVQLESDAPERTGGADGDKGIDRAAAEERHQRAVAEALAAPPTGLLWPRIEIEGARANRVRASVRLPLEPDRDDLFVDLGLHADYAAARTAAIDTLTALHHAADGLAWQPYRAPQSEGIGVTLGRHVRLRCEATSSGYAVLLASNNTRRRLVNGVSLEAAQQHAADWLTALAPVLARTLALFALPQGPLSDRMAQLAVRLEEMRGSLRVFRDVERLLGERESDQRDEVWRSGMLEVHANAEILHHAEMYLYDARHRLLSQQLQHINAHVAGHHQICVPDCPSCARLATRGVSPAQADAAEGRP